MTRDGSDQIDQHPRCQVDAPQHQLPVRYHADLGGMLCRRHAALLRASD